MFIHIPSMHLYRYDCIYTLLCINFANIIMFARMIMIMCICSYTYFCMYMCRYTGYWTIRHTETVRSLGIVFGLVCTYIGTYNFAYMLRLSFVLRIPYTATFLFCLVTLGKCQPAESGNRLGSNGQIVPAHGVCGKP